MRTGLIAKKLGMSSMFTDQGKRVTLTLLHLDKCQVVASRTMDKNGYTAVVVGAVLAKLSKVSKSMKKVFADSKIEPRSRLKEFRVSGDNLIEVGKELTVDHFKIGQYIDVQGRTIGKGFAGGMKRHNFRGLEASHGVSVSHRAHGSTGQCQDPGKVFKGKKMAGHMGDVNVTIQNLKVVDLDVEKGLLVVSGNVPGSKGSYVYVTDAIKKAVTI
jgi:large subunit ribosomal protein L3